MYKYAKFYQNISCGPRVISVFANCRCSDGWTDERPHTAIIVFGEPRHRFALDNVKIHKYTKFEPNNINGSRVMSIFTTDLKFSTDAQQSNKHYKKSPLL